MILCVFPGCQNRRRYGKDGLCISHQSQKYRGVTLYPIKHRIRVRKLGSYCTFSGCKNLLNANGLCVAHETQKKKGKELTPLRTPYPRRYRLCAGPECVREATRTGLCATHQWQAVTWGPDKLETIRVVRARESFERRLKRFVNKQEEGHGCWVWTGGKQHGYGVSWDGETRKIRLVHRMMKERQLGVRLATHQHLDHRCRNRGCVNPEHLDLVTQHENTKRMLAWHSLQTENQLLKARIQELEDEIAAIKNRGGVE